MSSFKGQNKMEKYVFDTMLLTKHHGELFVSEK
jgi:hypothetical protein